MTAPGPTRWRWAPDGWLLATSLAAGVGAARLTQAPGAARVVGPVVATVVVGHLATSGARRLRAPVPAAAGAGVVAVALATVWGQCFSATRSGIPTVTTWHALTARFQEAGSVIRSNPTPVPATTGVVLCIAVGAGLVAVMARSLWAGIEARGPGGPLAPLATLLPSFGLFCYTALLSSQVDRVAGAATYLVAALGFVLAADRPPVRPGLAAGAPHSGPPPRLVRSAVLGALTPALTAVVAVAVPLSLSPALTSLKVDALPFAHPGATGGGGGVSLGGAGTGPGGGGRNGTGPASLGGNGNGTGAGPPAIGVRTIDLVDDLQAVLTDRTGELMFSATSPVPTYWQVALLTRFNGTAWLPDPTTLAAVQAIPVSTAVRQIPGLPVLPEPAGTGTFRTTVAIADLESTLLPLPPTP
ncbi:MAG TPA: hypothetical protein VMB72_10505, partial [Acidimicrobiales bacterium]|nr:hypothetical protein [Acidimicrobiales bacterium]